MSVCGNCGRIFASAMQLGPHRRMCLRRQNPLNNLITEPAEGEPVLPDNLITEPVPTAEQISLQKLARRPTCNWGTPTRAPLNSQVTVHDENRMRDYRPMQNTWKQHVSTARQCCPDEFWRVFQAVQGETVTCRDKVLHIVKDLIHARASNIRWPCSMRTLRTLVARRAGTFWDNVTITKRIDLSHYNLPGCNFVIFTYVDPVWVWITRCNAIHEHNLQLQWDAKVLHHPTTGEEAYGAGIQYGLLLREANATIPDGSKAGIFNISWDGGNTGFGARSAVPICVRVSFCICVLLHV